MSKTRSRRQRKKLHIGEFQQLGFLFEATLTAGSHDEALVGAFVAEVIEPHGLGLGGWVTGGTVEKLGSQSVTEEERAAVLKWLAARPEVATLSASGLVDMWYATAQAQERSKVKG